MKRQILLFIIVLVYSISSAVGISQEWTWTSRSVDTTGDVGQYSSIDAEDASNIFISYYDATNQDLRFASTTDGGQTWTTQTVDSEGDAGKHSDTFSPKTSLGKDYRLIAYEQGDRLVKGARSTDRGATWELTSCSYQTCRDPSIYGYGNEVYLFYNYQRVPTWPRQTSLEFGIGTIGNLGMLRTFEQENSAYVDAHGADNHAFIVYSQTDANQLKFAGFYRPSLGFTTGVIDVGSVFEYPSIHTVKSNINAYQYISFISYYDATNGDLKFARQYASVYPWSYSVSVESGIKTTIDSVGDVGKYSSITATDNNNVYISYYDATNKNLKIAKSTDGGDTWAIETADSAGDVGQHSSIHSYQYYQQDPRIFVSYYDATNKDLKVMQGSCTSNYHNKCDTTDGCGSTQRTVDKGYNSCDLTSDTSCGMEAECNDGIDNDCDGLTDWEESTCAAVRYDWNYATAGDLAYQPPDTWFRLFHLQALDKNTVFVGYYDEGARQNKLAKSIDGGKTWTAFKIDDGYGLVVKSIFVVNENVIFVTYLRNDDIWFARSTDGGQTWSKFTVDDREPEDGNGPRGYSLAMYATDPSNVFISYYHGDYGPTFAKSTNGGQTWTLQPFPFQFRHDWSMFAEGNTIYIAAGHAVGNSLAFTKSTDGGSTWSTPVQIETSVGFMRLYPSIKVLGNTIFVSYYDSYDEDLRFAKSFDGGQTWFSQTIESDGSVGRFASMDVINSNHILIGYYREIPAGIKLAVTKDGGTTWLRQKLQWSRGLLSMDAVDSDTIFISDVIYNQLRVATSCVPVTYYKDADGDGYGNPSITSLSCTPPAGYVSNNQDCNDNDQNNFPGNPEVCDGKDNNCNGQIDEGGVCCTPAYYNNCDRTDGCGGTRTVPSGYHSCDLNSNTLCGSETTCDNIDNDCDGAVDEGLTITSGCSQVGYCSGSYKTCTAGTWGGCSKVPQTEICDNVDNDCDGTVDEGCDDDNDNYCDSTMTTIGAPSTCTNGGGDCLDTDAQVTPGIRKSKITGNTFPPNLACGNSYPVTLTIKNTGCDIWYGSLGYKLGAVGDSDPFGPARVHLASNIAPGQSHTFTFTLNSVVTGPQTTDWRMLREMVAWFGETFIKDYNVVSSPEVCDANDNDCDGVIDTFTSTSDCNQVGYCAGSVKTCINSGWGGCDKLPQLEICNDYVDNDCDGLTDCADTDCRSQAGPLGVTCCQNTADCIGFTEGNCGSISCNNNLCDVTPTLPNCASNSGQCGTFTNSCTQEGDGSYTCDYYTDDNQCTNNQYCGLDLNCINILNEGCAFNYDTCVSYATDGDPLTLPNDINECSPHSQYGTCASTETGSTDTGGAVC